MALGMTISEALKISKPLREMYENDETMHRLIEVAEALEGMPRHASMHAAGVVITDKPVYEYVPLSKNDESVVCQYQMTTLEELGLLKMDFLGLRNLTVLEDAAKMVRERKKRASLMVASLALCLQDGAAPACQKAAGAGLSGYVISSAARPAPRCRGR